MVGHLIESSKRSNDSLRAVVPSVVFHAVILAAAVYATTQTTTADVVHVERFIPISTYRGPSQEEPAPAGGAPEEKGTGAAAKPGPAVVQPQKIPVSVPQVQVQIPSFDVPVNVSVGNTGVGVDRSEFQSGGGAGGGSGIGGGGGGGIGGGRGTGGSGGTGRFGSYGVFEVDEPAWLDERQPRPRYPEVLQAANVQGTVVAEFVIDTSGRVEMKTLQIISADNELFAASVRAVLPKLRFHPAKAGGRKVRQLVRQPFTFSIK